MARFQLTIQIDRLPAEVFAYLADVERLPKWQKSAVSAEAEGEVRQGTLIRERRAFMGREVATELEVTAYDPPRRFDLASRGGPVAFEIQHALEPSNVGTRLEVEVVVKIGALMRIAAQGPLKLAEREFRDDFERLKEILEAGDGSP